MTENKNCESLNVRKMTRIVVCAWHKQKKQKKHLKSNKCPAVADHYSAKFRKDKRGNEKKNCEQSHAMEQWVS